MEFWNFLDDDNGKEYNKADERERQFDRTTKFLLFQEMMDCDNDYDDYD